MMKCILGDRVTFKCAIKNGTFYGEVIEVIENTRDSDDPMLLIQHIVEDGNSYHIRQSAIVERFNNVIFDPIICALVAL